MELKGIKRPRITTADGNEHVIRKLTGRDWRYFGEFAENAPQYTDADFLERQAEFLAKFYDGVTADDILDMPIEEIMPATFEVRNYIGEQLSAKFEKIEKNFEAGKEQ